jgi:molybdenum cofactor guanylyltransferase
VAEEKLPFKLRNDITGFVLAGGQSRRMGQDKASLRWGEASFLQLAVSRMRQVTSRVLISGGKEGAETPVLPDAIAGRGPLGGLHALLTHSNTDWNLVLALDMPLVSADLLRFIVDRCCEATLAVVPRLDAGKNSAAAPASVLQPLCAAYHRGLQPAIEQALASGDLSIHRLLERVSTGMMSAETKAVRVIDEDELLSAGFSRELLFNVNTPKDLERARALARTLHVE